MFVVQVRGLQTQVGLWVRCKRMVGTGKMSKGKDTTLPPVTTGGKKKAQMLYHSCTQNTSAPGDRDGPLILSHGPWLGKNVLRVLLEWSRLFWDGVGFIALSVSTTSILDSCLCLFLYVHSPWILVENLICNTTQPALLSILWWGTKLCWVRKAGCPIFCVHLSLLSLLMQSQQQEQACPYNMCPKARLDVHVVFPEVGDQADWIH